MDQRYGLWKYHPRKQGVSIYHFGTNIYYFGTRFFLFCLFLLIRHLFTIIYIIFRYSLGVIPNLLRNSRLKVGTLGKPQDSAMVGMV